MEERMKILKATLGKPVVNALIEQGLMIVNEERIIIINEPFIYFGKTNKYIKRYNTRKCVLSESFINMCSKINNIEIVNQ